MRFYKNKKLRRGVALILSMIFVAVFASLSFAMVRMGSGNVQIADNHRSANQARSGADSGCDYVRYWMGKDGIGGTVYISSAVAANQRVGSLLDIIDGNLSAMGITNYTYTPGSNVMLLGSSDTGLTFSPAGTGGDQCFWGQIYEVDSATIGVEVTGRASGVVRKIAANYTIRSESGTALDFGVASRGPVQLSGNTGLLGVEADIYIESFDSDLALSMMGSSEIEGNVSIANPAGWADLGNNASIGGLTGQDAIDNHVEIGVPAAEFPVPNTSIFEAYVGTDVIDSTTDLSVGGVYDNVRIIAGTNPTFSDGMVFNGVVFIESPNNVTFTGGVVITGVIVGDGDYTDNSGTNTIEFLGNVSSASVEDLPADSQFDGLRDETGTFLLAPGFSVAMGGSFGTLNGAIAANGISFFGNAGGTIAGSVLNYSPIPMTLSGNSDLQFNHSGTTDVPAGFELDIMLFYNPASYSEVL